MASYSPIPPDTATLESSDATILLEFGADWCGFCRRAQPLVDEVLARHPDIRHLRVEDGPGRALGRAFRVKLWPTLILMFHGREIGRVVRPDDAAALDALLATSSGAA